MLKLAHHSQVQWGRSRKTDPFSGVMPLTQITPPKVWEGILLSGWGGFSGLVTECYLRTVIVLSACQSINKAAMNPWTTWMTLKIDLGRSWSRYHTCEIGGIRAAYNLLVVDNSLAQSWLFGSLFIYAPQNGYAIQHLIPSDSHLQCVVIYLEFCILR